jgi:uncharacterized delta-60 repeat protein
MSWIPISKWLGKALCWTAGPVLLVSHFALAQTSLVDPTFDPGTGALDGIVETVLAQPDGKILICGNFLSVNGVDQGFIARLHSDGSVDTGFQAHPGYWVRHMALQDDGKIVIGGFFTNVEGEPRNRIARLHADGSLDRASDPGLGAQTKIVEGDDKEPFVFWVVAQPDQKILITGNFRTYNGVARSGIARINPDGSLDSTFDAGSGFDSWGRHLLLLPNDQILASGWFTSYNGQPFNRMVRLNSNGSADPAFRPNFGDKTAIYTAVALPDGQYIAAGHSLNEQGLFRQEMARLNPDGAFDTSYPAFANEKIESIYLQPDGKLILGGYFTLVNGVPRNGLARLNADGTLDETFKAETDNFVWTVAPQPDGKVLVSGGFYTVDGISRRGVARLAVDSGAPPLERPPLERPRLQRPALERGQFRVLVPTKAGRMYTLQFRQLNSSRWNSRPVVMGDGTLMRLVDPDAVSSSHRFYRVLVSEAQ